jgi:hypothetical protein
MKQKTQWMSLVVAMFLVLVAPAASADGDQGDQGEGHARHCSDGNGNDASANEHCDDADAEDGAGGTESAGLPVGNHVGPPGSPVDIGSGSPPEPRVEPGV